MRPTKKLENAYQSYQAFDERCYDELETYHPATYKCQRLDISHVPFIPDFHEELEDLEGVTLKS